jgi:thioesterase domain-containing protein
MTSSLVLFHDATGLLEAVTPLAAKLQGVRVVGVERRMAGSVRDLPDLVERYLARLERAGLSAPWRFGGFSFGGTLAYEAARIMAGRSQDVELLAIFDAEPPQVHSRREQLDASIGSLGKALGVQSAVLTDILVALEENALDFETLNHVLPKGVINAVPPHRRASSPECIKTIKNILECVDMLSRYSPETVAQPHRTLSFRSKQTEPAIHAGWRDLVQGAYEDIAVPGDHNSVLRDQGLGIIAARLNHLALHWQWAA